MGRTNRPDTLVTELAALKRRVAQLETQQRLSSARISSGQLNVGAVGAPGQIEIDATDGQIRILKSGVVLAALSTDEGLFLSGYNTGDAVNGVILQPKNTATSAFAPANIFARTDPGTGESDLWITSQMDANVGQNTAAIIMRGSDAANGNGCSIYFDAFTMTVGGELVVDGDLTYTQWTPAVTGGGSATFGTLDGWYYRLGNLIFFNAYIVATAAGSGTSNIAISLPVTPFRGTANRRQTYFGTLSDGVVAGTNGGQLGPLSCLTFASGTTGIDRVLMSNGVNLQGQNISASSIITVQGIVREA